MFSEHKMATRGLDPSPTRNRGGPESSRTRAPALGPPRAAGLMTARDEVPQAGPTLGGPI